jgi:hypothetical protein
MAAGALPDSSDVDPARTSSGISQRAGHCGCCSWTNLRQQESHLEPQPDRDRLWRDYGVSSALPNVIVTPHAAYYSEQAITTVRRIAAEEAVRVLTGQSARSPVNDVTADSP